MPQLTAAITGAWVALRIAIDGLIADKRLKSDPITASVAAVSCGIVEGEAVLDLDYAEDSAAQADANFVLTGSGGIVEIQGTAETEPFSRERFADMLRLAESGISRLIALQAEALNRG